MAPVGHNVPSNPPPHEAGKNFRINLLELSARFVIEFTVSDTRRQIEVSLHLKAQHLQLWDLLVRRKSLTGLAELQSAVGTANHSTKGN